MPIRACVVAKEEPIAGNVHIRYLRWLPVLAIVGVYYVLATADFSEPDFGALDRKPIPEFSLPGLKHKSDGVSSADLRRGKVSVVNVFASWCAPCLREHRYIRRLAGPEGVPVYAINFRDDPDNAARWLEDLGNPYLGVGRDQDGRVSAQWLVAAIPVTFIIDGDGMIRRRFDGSIDETTLERKILPIIRYLQANP